MTRKLNLMAKEKGVSIIGPATVGGVKPGCFKIGNTGGMMDNILHSKLYRPGSVAYVSRYFELHSKVLDIHKTNCVLNKNKYATFRVGLENFHHSQPYWLLGMKGF